MAMDSHHFQSTGEDFPSGPSGCIEQCLESTLRTLGI